MQLRLSSAVDFALTSTDGSSNLVGDALRKGFDNASGIFKWSDTGETLTIDHLSFGTADKTAFHLMMEHSLQKVMG